MTEGTLFSSQSQHEQPTAKTPSPSPHHQEEESESPGVYFGPFQSPEKKFLPLVARRLNHQSRHWSPRRSPRLTSPRSTSPSLQPIEPDDGVTSGHDAVESDDEEYASGTPDIDRFPPDEPSSALADRIIRALDNPSPPPRHEDLPDGIDEPTKDTFTHKLVDISHSPATNQLPSLPVVTGTLAPGARGASPVSDFIFSPAPVFPSLLSRRFIPSPPSPHPGSASHRDLISFDLCDIPWTFDPPQTDAAQRSPPTPRLTTHARNNVLITIDDLLSSSPAPSASASHLVAKRDTVKTEAPGQQQAATPPRQSPPLSDLDVTPTDPSKRSQSEVSDENEVSASLILSADIPADIPTIDESDDTYTSNPVVPVVLPLAFPQVLLDSVAPLTSPLRRSPRRSTTPQPLIPATTPTPTRSRQRRKNERVFPPIHEVASGSQDGRSRSTSKEPDSEISRVGSEEADPSLTCESAWGGPDNLTDKECNDGNSTEGNTSPEKVFSRELGSLSPNSTVLLDKLLTTPKGDHESTSPRLKDTLTPTVPQPHSFSVFGAAEASTATPSASETVDPFHSPFRILASPSKTTSGADATYKHSLQTPARRVVMTPTTPSSQKPTPFSFKLGATVGHALPRTPIFSKPDLSDPLQSPRRVPLNVTAKPPRTGSPTRAFLKERSSSADPKPGTSTAAVRGQSASSEPVVSAGVLGDEPFGVPGPGPSTSSSTSKLPFPIVAAERPATIPEVGGPPATPEGGGMRKPVVTKPAVFHHSPKKSSLRQPSASVTSRIPRMGAKPYARPPAGKKDSKASTTVGKASDSSTTAESRSTTPKATGHVRPTTAESSSNEVSSKASRSALPPSRGQAIGSSMTKDAQLKRKRDANRSTSEKPRSALVIRPVPPDPIPAIPSKVVPSRTQPDSSPRKPPGPAVIRRVPDLAVAKPPEALDRDVRTLDDDAAKDALKAPLPGSPPPARALFALDQERPTIVIDDVTPPSSPLRRDPPPAAPFQLPEKLPPKPTNSVRSSSDDETAEASRRVRRTTRARKPVQVADIFGTYEMRSPPRRKHNASTARMVDGESFSGMTAVALKALTSSNTMRNQQYLVARLETEVVRVEGARPESPGIKVRTISQKQFEEKQKGRQERAERRARRSEEGPVETDGLSEPEDYSGYLNADEGTPEKRDEDGQLLRHRRGPGDEEDYETPDRSDSAEKRMRFGESEEEMRVKKRVKWDRGLSKTVYLDELRPGERPRPGEIATKKGCLAPTAKTVRLDTLGNIPDADAPLGDLIHEDIVVKKFVYDTDMEVEAVVAKGTRSKGKKAKA